MINFKLPSWLQLIVLLLVIGTLVVGFGIWGTEQLSSMFERNTLAAGCAALISFMVMGLITSLACLMSLENRKFTVVMTFAIIGKALCAMILWVAGQVFGIELFTAFALSLALFGGLVIAFSSEHEMRNDVARSNTSNNRAHG